VWLTDAKRDVLPKPRKWGFSTQRVGLGLHGCMYTEGRWCRVVAHKEKTALELNRTTKRFYESAQRHFVKLGLDPDYFLPRLKFDNKREYYFPDIDSAIIFDTARGAGIGQSDRSDDLYLTEYSFWPDAEDKRGALVSSLPIGGEGRATIDFNADGIGNDAYVLYMDAKNKGGAGWNGYEPVFFGINDFPGVYSEAFLDAQRQEFGKQFVRWYPSNDREMFIRSEASVFEPDDIDACTRAKYFVDEVGAEQAKLYEYIHGVDTATGESDGCFSCMSGFEVESGREAYKPYRELIPIHVFAPIVDKIARQYPGVVVVERNSVGEALIFALREMGTPGLYRYKKKLDGGTKSKLGFITSLKTKAEMIRNFQAALAAGDVELVSGNGIRELKQFEWKDGEKLAGKPDASGFYDDEADTKLLAWQGLKQLSAGPKAGVRDW
jgi:hypothetical protein